jgi:hypothetical protein
MSEDCIFHNYKHKMKKHLTFLLVLLAGCTHGQKVVYEITEGSPYSSFVPRALTISNSGSVFITGGFDRTIKYYKTVNGKTVRADSTLPGDNTMFVMKMDANGKMVKRAFCPMVYSLMQKRVYAQVIEGNDITITRDGNLLVTGFVTGYRERNYEGDRTQGVYAALIDTNFRLVWDTLYPSYYNSVGEKVMETADGNFIINASVFLRKDSVSQYLDNHVTGTRLLKISKKGRLLVDTLLATLPRDFDYDFYTNHPKAKSYFYHNYNDSDVGHFLPPFEVEAGRIALSFELVNPILSKRSLLNLLGFAADRILSRIPEILLLATI